MDYQIKYLNGKADTCTIFQNPVKNEESMMCNLVGYNYIFTN